MIGNVVENIACLQCGWVPSTPEDDGWVGYLEMLEAAHFPNGRKMFTQGPQGYAK